MPIDPAPRVDRSALLGDLLGGLPAGDALHMRFGLSERPPDADLGIPGAVHVLRSHLDPVPAIVRLDQQGLASRRLIVSPLWRWRQRQTCRT